MFSTHILFYTFMHSLLPTYQNNPWYCLALRDDLCPHYRRPALWLPHYGSHLTSPREISFPCRIVREIFKQVTLLSRLPSGSVVKIPLAWQKTQRALARSLDQQDPLEKEMATQSSIRAWKTPWTEEPGGLQFIELQRVRLHWATKHAHTLLSEGTWKSARLIRIVWVTGCLNGTRWAGPAMCIHGSIHWRTVASKAHSTTFLRDVSWELIFKVLSNSKLE